MIDIRDKLEAAFANGGPSERLLSWRKETRMVQVGNVDYLHEDLSGEVHHLSRWCIYKVREQKFWNRKSKWNTYLWNAKRMDYMLCESFDDIEEARRWCNRHWDTEGRWIRPYD